MALALNSNNLQRPSQFELTAALTSRVRLQGIPLWRMPVALSKPYVYLVGAGRFERPTPCAQGRCATRLRYAPTFTALLILNHFLDFRYRPAGKIEPKPLSHGNTATKSHQ